MLRLDLAGIWCLWLCAISMTIATVTDATSGGVSAAEKMKIAENVGSVSLDVNQTASVEGSCSAASVEEEEDKPKGGKVLKTAVTNMAPAVATDSEVSDIQKKIRRAERFGTPVVLSEEEKRNSRAEREKLYDLSVELDGSNQELIDMFKTASTLAGSKASKTSEELKRKARAERFGIPVPPTPSDEDAKKKARLARFGGHTNSESIEDKKKFSKPISGPPSQVNGNGNIEQKAAIADKAV